MKAAALGHLIAGGLFGVLCMLNWPLAAGQQPGPAEFNGVRVEVMERAHDGDYPLQPDRSSAALKLDANSTLGLRFVLPGAVQPAQPAPEWIALERAITELKNLTGEFEQLSQLAAKLESVDLAAWQQRNLAFGQTLAAFLDLFDGPQLQALVSKEEVAKLRRQARLQGKAMYGPLGELLESKRRALIGRADKLGTALSGDTVTVVAYVIPRSGEARQIHVPEYDNIEARPVRAFSRTSPVLNQAEAQRLREEYEGARIVSKAVDELVGKREQIGEQIRTLGKKLEERAKRFVTEARSLMNALNQARVAELVRALAQAPSEDARRFRDALTALQADADAIRATADGIESLVKDVRSADALELLLAMQRANALATDIKTQLGALPDRIQRWPGHMDTIARTASRMALEPVLQGQSELLASLRTLNTTVTEDLRTAGASLLDVLPQLKTAIDYVSEEKFTAQGGHAIAAASAFDPAVQVVAVSLEQAKDTQIDLRRSGIALGEDIEVKVNFKAGQGSAARDKTLTYAGEAVLTGWHRRYSGDVIFARARNGPGSDSYKPNAAVSLEWHHFSRSERRKFLNWLDPGVGFHAANLDQNQDQTVELGAGVNLSVWNGLIRIGYGYNLSVKEDRPYYWIGFGLFGMLNRLNDLPAFKP